MPKVLGLGNALVDVMTRLPNDEFLFQHNFPKGSMQLVNLEISKNIISGSEGFEQSLASGGSAANTIHGLARLGIETGFIGKIGHDQMGEFFKNDLIQSHINPKLLYGTANTGIAVALVSPDSERTFATYLGAAVEMVPSELNPMLFDGYDYFHIEGYLAHNHNLISEAVKIAKNKGMIISLDMASYNVVEANLEFLKSVTKEFVDIIFANEEEAKSFTGKEPEQALEIISKDCKIAVVKLGDKGSIIKTNNKVYKTDAIKVKSLDTTGAGDLYAAGFIYGLIKGLSPEKCGRIGGVMGGNVIEFIGAKMDNQRWEVVRQMVKEIEFQD